MVLGGNHSERGDRYAVGCGMMIPLANGIQKAIHDFASIFEIVLRGKPDQVVVRLIITLSKPSRPILLRWKNCSYEHSLCHSSTNRILKPPEFDDFSPEMHRWPESWQSGKFN